MDFTSNVHKNQRQKVIGASGMDTITINFKDTPQTLCKFTPSVSLNLQRKAYASMTTFNSSSDTAPEPSKTTTNWN